jgi:hypothetical protein
MIVVEELLSVPQSQLSVRVPDVDPLRDEDALQEGQLIDFRVSALGSVAALLFDLRTSLQLDEGNASLLIVRGLDDLRWREVRTFSPLTAFTVVGSRTLVSGVGLIGVEIDFFPDASLVIRGIEAEFYVMDIPNIGEVPPDYSEASFEEIKDSLPAWTSACLLLQASNLEAP